LPFRSDSSDHRCAYFADGLCEDIITSLSSISRLMVVGSSSSFAYKGREVDAKRVGRELGVAHVLEGSVRTSGDRLRIVSKAATRSLGNKQAPKFFELGPPFPLRGGQKRNSIGARRS
jgi:TolB-like protein